MRVQLSIDIKSATCRALTRTVACLLTLSAFTLAALPDPLASAQIRATTARTLRARDSAKLHCIQSKSSGSRLFEEGTAMRLAYAYEQATDWHTKHPALQT